MISIDSVSEFRQKRNETLAYIRHHTDARPNHLLILRTGLGQLATGMDVHATHTCAEIPHFPVSTVESRAGRLLFGMLGGKAVVAMQGRFHSYEGYSMQQTAFP